MPKTLEVDCDSQEDMSWYQLLYLDWTIEQEREVCLTPLVLLGPYTKM